jgi:UDP-perosamine 4-acetyltransferase
VIGNHAHIAPGATLSGAVQVGQLSHIGTGASVRQGIRIGERAVVGVGSVVVRDVPDGAVVRGVPARQANATLHR